jgi:hypothetical protein
MGKHRRMFGIVIGFCPLVAALLAVSCNTENWGPRVRRDRQLAVSAPLQSGKTLRAETKDGAISVQAADVKECRLTANIQVHASNKQKAAELADAIQITLRATPDGLETVTDIPRTIDSVDCRIALTLVVPRRTALKLTSGRGAIQVKDVEGPVEANTAKGEVKVETAKGDVNLTSHNGSVTCTRSDSNSIELYSGDGDIWLSESRAVSCNIRGANSSVYLADLHADILDIRTSVGGVRCRNVAAQKLDCSNSEGSVYITWAPDAPKSPDITVAAGDGNITFVGINNVSVVLNAFTKSGHINARIPGIAESRIDKSIQATIGPGGGRLVLSTHNGVVAIQ